MKQRTLIMVLSLLAVAGAAAFLYLRLAPRETFYGQWIVTELVGTTPITAMDDEYAKEFIGKVVTYTPEYARFGEESFPNPKYARGVLTENEVRYDWKMRPEQSGFLTWPKPVFYSISDKDGRHWTHPGGSFFLTKDGTLVISWDGGFFEMVRKRW